MDAVDSARLLPPRTGLWEPRSFHTDAGGYLLRQYQTSRGVTNRRYITSWDENGLPQLHRKRASLLLQPCWIRTNELQASVCRIVRVIVFPSRLVLWLDITFSQILARETGHSHQTVWQIKISSTQGSMGIPRLGDNVDCTKNTYNYFLAGTAEVCPSLNTFNSVYLTWHNVENNCSNKSMFNKKKERLVETLTGTFMYAVGAENLSKSTVSHTICKVDLALTELLDAFVVFSGH